MLVHEGDPRGARHAGRCVIAMGGWVGQTRLTSGHGSEGNVVVAGNFPVLSVGGSNAGEVSVRLRACLGESSKLRTLLPVSTLAGNKIDVVGQRMAEGAVGGDASARLRTNGTLAKGGASTLNGAQPQARRLELTGLPGRASFESDDLSDECRRDSPTAAGHALQDAATLSSFQLNETLARFDASDTLPVWPTPKGSMYRPPETHGEAPLISCAVLARNRGRFLGSTSTAGVKKATLMSNARGEIVRSPQVRVGVALGGTSGISTTLGGSPGQSGLLGPHTSARPLKSVSPERQAPEPNFHNTPLATSLSDLDGKRDEKRGRASSSVHVGDSAESRRHAHAAIEAPADQATDDRTYLSQLLNRGNDLREKMAVAAGNGTHVSALNTTSSALPPPSSKNSASLGAPDVIGLPVPPGLLSGAPLGSSLRDDIEGIFDTLSEDGAASGDPGASVRDPETRAQEDNVVNLLLEAAGPPPASLAFPALAAVERRRADSLSRVRFLRIHLSRLVMFGSMNSAPDGHGWQMRFLLPDFVSPPARGSNELRAGSIDGKRARAREERYARNRRVVSLPIPPRAPSSLSSKGKAVRRGTFTSRTATNAPSALRVRRGYGASDLTVGETSLLEEMVCAVDVDDACVRRWMDTEVEFLLVDGKHDGAPRAPRAQVGQNQDFPSLRREHKHPQRVESLTVGEGDRVVAVAKLPLRDLLLSAELGVVATLDLTVVSSFWATEDTRIAAAGHRSRGGRPLRNPYRSDAENKGPLVLGDRVVGALAVALELVPGEANMSPENSRPRVAGWSTGRRDHGMSLMERDSRHVGAQAAGDEGSGELRTAAMGPARPSAVVVPTEQEPPPASDMAMGVAVEEQNGAAVEPVTTKASDDERVAAEDGRTTPPAVPSPNETGASMASAPAGPAHATYAVTLTIGDLTLDPAVAPEVEEVRIAYSYTQVWLAPAVASATDVRS